MKNLLIIIFASLLFLTATGCSEEEPLGTVKIMGTQMIYKPQSPDKMPDWLQSLAHTIDDTTGWICVTRWEGHTVYIVYCTFHSSWNGWVYSEDGGYIGISEGISTFLENRKNWKCIYYVEPYFNAERLL